jgi:vacuolar-type H+-ATPase subunit E/Vma4
MVRNKIFRTIIIIVLAGIVTAGAVGFYMFNMPHRDVQSAKSDFVLTVSDVVAEYLENPEAANLKYLASNGESKILKVSGKVKKISENYSGSKVVLLQEDDDKAGVSATFTAESAEKVGKLKVGQFATIKGVIRSGASFDPDLNMYENVILEKSDVILN